jgi:hypothetical protein
MANFKSQELRKANITKLKEMGKDYDQIDTLVDLLESGVKPMMKSSFVPNGGSHFNRQSRSYSENRALCNRHILKMRAQGRAIILPCDIIPKGINEFDS